MKDFLYNENSISLTYLHYKIKKKSNKPMQSVAQYTLTSILFKMLAVLELNSTIFTMHTMLL